MSDQFGGLMRGLSLPNWVLIALLLLVPLGLACILPAPSSDTRELLSWGLHPTLSTPKQPPLMQWAGFLVMRLAWPTTFWCVALMQALNAIGLAYCYATLQLWSKREQAALSTLLFANAIYFTGAPVAFALNADILQFPFWAAILFHGLRAFETRRVAHWIGLTAAFVLAFYTKYTVVLLVLPMAVASLSISAYRSVWRDARLYLSAASALLMIAPHLIAAQHSGAVSHATGALFASGGVFWRLRNFRELLLGFLVYLAPGWIWLLIASMRGEIERAMEPGRSAQFVRITGATAFGLLLFLVICLGFKYPSRYDSPFLFIAWLCLSSGLRWAPNRLPAVLRWVKGATLGIAAAVLVGGVITYGVVTVHPRQQEPLLQAAALLQAEWQSQYSCGPAYVMGDFWSAYGLGISMQPPIPGVHLIEIEGAPGYDESLRAKRGAILIYHDRIDEKEARSVFPDLDLSQARRLTLSFAHTLDRKPTISYAYLFIAPKQC